MYGECKVIPRLLIHRLCTTVDLFLPSISPSVAACAASSLIRHEPNTAIKNLCMLFAKTSAQKSRKVVALDRDEGT